MSDSNISLSHPDQTEVPLWRRTQLRLQRMETWSMQRRLTWNGSDEHIQLYEERIAIACRHLVLLLEWEENASVKTPLD